MDVFVHLLIVVFKVNPLGQTYVTMAGTVAGVVGTVGETGMVRVTGAVLADTVTGDGVTVTEVVAACIGVDEVEVTAIACTDTGTLTGITAALETAVPALVVTHLTLLAAELSTGFTYDETVKQYLVLGCRPVTT